MTCAISFNNSEYPGFFTACSFDVMQGSRVAIKTSRDDETALLSRMISGVIQLAPGMVRILGKNVAEIPAKELYQLRRQIGCVPANGGLISNLKLWENLVLPALFHNGCVSAVDEESVYALLKDMGYSGNVMALPAHLSLFEKRMAAFIRATLHKPDIMVYCNCFESLTDVFRKRLLRAAEGFHAAGTNVTSIYLVTSDDAIKDLSVDTIISIN